MLQYHRNTAFYNAWITQTLDGPASLCLSLTSELERIRFAGFSTSELDSVWHKQNWNNAKLTE